MESPPLTVILTDSAVHDLEAIDEYWTRRQEPDRGRQYVRDLISTAEFTLSDLQQARLGRLVKSAVMPGTREILAYRIYRIIYRLDEIQGTVLSSAIGTPTARLRLPNLRTSCKNHLSQS